MCLDLSEQTFIFCCWMHPRTPLPPFFLSLVNFYHSDTDMYRKVVNGGNRTHLKNVQRVQNNESNLSFVVVIVQFWFLASSVPPPRSVVSRSTLVCFMLWELLWWWRVCSVPVTTSVPTTPTFSLVSVSLIQTSCVCLYSGRILAVSIRQLSVVLLNSLSEG